MEIKELIAIVLSSTVLTTIITAVLNLITNKRKESIENITKERKEWRDQLRSIATEIQECENLYDLSVPISKLKVRINAYGIINNSILKDSHLWDKMYDLEQTYNKTQINETKQLKYFKNYFINQISCLLKFDWERSKTEITGNRYIIFVITSLVVSFFLCTINWLYYYHSIGNEIISNCVSFCVLYAFIFAFSVFVISYKWKSKLFLVWFNLIGGILLFIICPTLISKNLPVFTNIESSITYLLPYILSLLTLSICAIKKISDYIKFIEDFLNSSNKFSTKDKNL